MRNRFVLAAVGAVPVAAITAIISAATPAPPTQISVPLVADRLSLGSTKAEPGAEGHGLKLAFPKTDWPSVWFGAGKAYDSPDMSKIGGITFEVHNPNPTPLQVFIRVDDSPEADGTKHCRSGNATLEPNETATLVFPLSGDVQGMRAGPPLVSRSVKPKQLAIYGPTLDDKNIVGFQVFLAKPDRAYDLDLRSVHLVPKPDMVGIVDRWGQYSREDWPGKIKSDADLMRSATEESAWLKANPALADRDEYGAWKTGPTLKASGFFRTALVAQGKEITAPKFGTPLPDGSRWWLVAPNGHLFWSTGADCIRPYSESPVKGKETMFAELSDEAKKSGQTDFYLQNLGRKYNGAWQKAWIDSDVARMQSWGFNTAGNWSDPDLFRARKVPYTVPLYVGGLPKIGNNPLPDYFDERFPELSRGSFLDQTSTWKNDPWCLGYFVDNELAWDTWAQLGTGGEYVVARDTLAAPATQPARRAFIKLLQARYPTPADWSKSWGVPIQDWDSPLTIPANALNAAAKTDCAAFSTALAERYFSVTRDALKAAAPNQLYLGCRFAIRPFEMVNVAARYCDVVSFNIYSDTVDAKTWDFTSQLGKPVMIGEFHFGATDRGMFHPGLRERPTQADRAQAYAAYVQSARAMPAFVGCHWFQWLDEPLTGRFDGENYNIGFVTVTDTPYPEMIQAARRVHSTLYSAK